MFYESVFVELARSEVRYAVAGGVAASLYGVPRVTVDLDLVVEHPRIVDHAIRVLAGEVLVPVASIDDLIEMKLRDGRDRVIHDVDTLSSSVKTKLECLEDVNQFLDIAITPEKREIMNRYRRGELGHENHHHRD